MPIPAVCRSRRERGSILVEFAVCMAIIWIPLMFGTWGIGFSLIREAQVTQICRDAGHMYSQGIDFSQPNYKALLQSLTPGTIQITGTGNTLVYLSTIIYVDANQCVAGGYSSGVCPNLGKAVFSRQLPVGNVALGFASKMGTPTGLMDANYNVSAANYARQAAAIANGFPSAIQLSSNSSLAYVGEVYVHSPDYNFWNLVPTDEYSYSIF